MIDSKLQIELRKRYNPDGSDLRKAQLRMLSVLIFLDKVCKENGLEYWLDSGTLIGAARHGGFIPWDDDIDVCMMKNDADRLKQILGDKIWDDHIVLQSNDTDSHYYNASWMTLRDTQSEYVTDSYAHRILKYRGVQIDIFVMEEDIPINLLKFSNKLFNFFITSPLYGRHGLTLLRPLVRWNYKLINKGLFSILRNIRKKSTTISSGLGCSFLKIQEKDTVFPLSTLEFEGYYFNVPNDPNKYLTKLYKHWIQIPSNIKVHTEKINIYE